jgi:uncharacterized protein YdcH (DUF465 family)
MIEIATGIAWFSRGAEKHQRLNQKIQGCFHKNTKDYGDKEVTTLVNQCCA